MATVDIDGGGKEDVVGIVLPKKDEEIFLNEIFNSLGWLK